MRHQHLGYVRSFIDNQLIVENLIDHISNVQSIDEQLVDSIFSINCLDGYFFVKKVFAFFGMLPLFQKSYFCVILCHFLNPFFSFFDLYIRSSIAFFFQIL